jgi:N-acetyl-beta-hexosaminidase
MKNLHSFRLLIMLFIIALNANKTLSQNVLDSLFPIRGMCIAIPDRNNLERFVKFINEELSVKKFNTLILRVDYMYQFESHPELKEKGALAKQEIKKIVEACKKTKINLIPQINLLGHQSWAEELSNLLKIYPEFDETPHVKMPAKYSWPNADGLYCKSYCPLHPGVHKVVFELVDEICGVFESDAFHAGMDEVFYIGDDKCPRCSGYSKAELFAGEVTKIRNHLILKDRRLWIWGDRLINGQVTGMGMWEASMNNTHQAIDLIPKDVMICDWHYERPDQTAVYFAMKGFDVITCPWRTADIAVKQVNDMLRFRTNSTTEMKMRFNGMLQTVWSGVGSFLDEYYSEKPPKNPNESQAQCFKALIKEMDIHNK